MLPPSLAGTPGKRSDARSVSVTVLRQLYAMPMNARTHSIFVVVTLRHSDVSRGAHPPVTAHRR